MAALQTNRGGRPPGSKDLHTLMGRERIGRYSVEAVEFCYAVMKDRIVCTVCNGKGKQPVTGKGGKMHERECQSCKARGREILRPELRFAAAVEIMDRGGVPREKQVDHVSSDGSQVTGIRIISVRAGDTIIEAGTSPPRLMEAHERGSSGD